MSIGFITANKEEIKMDEKEFSKLAKTLIIGWVAKNVEQSNWKGFDVYVVWMCKTLQNNKAMLSTTIHDGRYYEVTYNGDKEEVYLDIYKKEENVPVKIENGDIAGALIDYSLSGETGPKGHDGE